MSFNTICTSICLQSSHLPSHHILTSKWVFNLTSIYKLKQCLVIDRVLYMYVKMLVSTHGPITLRWATIGLEILSMKRNSTWRKSILIKMVLLCLQSRYPKVSMIFVAQKLDESDALFFTQGIGVRFSQWSKEGELSGSTRVRGMREWKREERR